MRVAIGIATAGRAEQMQLTLRQIALQRVLPVRTIVCPATPDDFDEEVGAVGLNHPLQVVRAARGLCAQRNAILRACDDIDVLVFLDDDYYPAPDYVAQVQALFADRADLVVATNPPALDGATGPGVSHDEALQVIAALQPMAVGGSVCTDTYGGYGCNMAIRLAPVRRHQLQFDERLPLYGWLEDIDFSRRLAPYGRIAAASALRGVHLATKRGRTAGVRIGYSQIANPIYMVRKGSMTFNYACPQVLRNLAKNLARAAWPEPWVDRRGRLKGNLLGLRDLVSNRLDPMNILSL
jgi:GT2 family glycosyltransferase